MPSVLGLQTARARVAPPDRPPERGRRRVVLVVAGALGVLTAGAVGVRVAHACRKPPSVVLANPQGGPPKLDLEALQKLSASERQQALADYGRALAGSRRDRPAGPSDAPGQPGATNDARREDMRKTLGQLSEDDRRAMFRAMGEGRQKERLDEIRAFFKLTPEEQTAALDKRLDAMAARAQTPRERPQGENRPGGAGGGAPRARTDDPKTRLEHFRDRLDNTTPEDRALQQAYFAALQKRATERGMSLGGNRFGGR